ncbi:MAG TPA: alcohol dehydrogenase catalytic domain-containing protein [Actinomycetota bacterium]|nr:alcohol dehydrogenase catalytic domain-containing protein [Actinomycetota bacterium]
MRQLVYLGPRVMDLQEAPDPSPGPGELVFETDAAAICGSDLHGFREASPRRIPPLVMGHEAVGRVSAVGTGVDSARVGEHVVLRPILACGVCEPCRGGRPNLCRSGRLVGRELTGAFAERFVVPERAAVGFPSDVPDDVATLTEPLANAVHVTSRAVQPDDDVFVIGAGAIGVLMARMALERGARRAFVTDPIVSRLDLARAQGAIPLEGEDPAAAALEATDGRGVDVAIDAAGFGSTWDLGVRALRPGGRFEAVGLGSPEVHVNAFAVAGKELTITGSFAWTEEDFDRAIALIAAGGLDTSGWFTTMPLADGQRAFEALVDTTERFKVVLVP